MKKHRHFSRSRAMPYNVGGYFPPPNPNFCFLKRCLFHLQSWCQSVWHFHADCLFLILFNSNLCSVISNHVYCLFCLYKKCTAWVCKTTSLLHWFYLTFCYICFKLHMHTSQLVGNCYIPLRQDIYHFHKCCSCHCYSTANICFTTSVWGHPIEIFEMLLMLQYFLV